MNQGYDKGKARANVRVRPYDRIRDQVIAKVIPTIWIRVMFWAGASIKDKAQAQVRVRLEMMGWAMGYGLGYGFQLGISIRSMAWTIGRAMVSG